MSTVDDAAREFGQHIKQGGWRLGLLVATSAEPGQPGRPKKCSPENVFEAAEDEVMPEGSETAEDSEKADPPSKVSISEFARRAGVSKSRVLYYYNAWEFAAGDGLCQHAKDLLPGEEDASIEVPSLGRR